MMEKEKDKGKTMKTKRADESWKKIQLEKNRKERMQEKAEKKE
jgi:hypothetical protein